MGRGIVVSWMASMIRRSAFSGFLTGVFLVASLSFSEPTPERTAAAASSSGAPFAIVVVDEQTGRGVPLVELRTVNQLSWWTDSCGVVAFNEPGLMDNGEVYFRVESPGYDFPKDMFGNRGVRLKPTPGGAATLKIHRVNIAERLYRVTGEGIYRDSILTGRSVPTKRPLLNGRVTGQDTVVATPYRGKIFWFWGDTDQIGYPLGNFGVSGATSEWPDRGGLDPDKGVDLEYFVGENGFSRSMCPLPGPGAHWIEQVMTVADETGVERLVARVATHTHLGSARCWTLVVYNDEKDVFEPVCVWDIHDSHDSSHPFRARVDGVEYAYLYPNWRAKPDLESLKDLNAYEALTCVAGDGKIEGKDVKVERDARGRAVYRWKTGADRLTAGRVRRLIASGAMKPEDSWIDFHDVETGERIHAGRGSVYWNEFRRRWIMLSSSRRAGEIWFAEGDTPSGPWIYARRVATHGDYNYYNPTQHPFFDRDGGRIVYFDGTYTDSFSDAKARTPRYNYNQLMYRLALDDLRLSLPAAVYRLGRAEPMGGKDANGRKGIPPRYRMREDVEAEGAWEAVEEAAFHAIPPARMREGLIAVRVVERDGAEALEAGPASVDPAGASVGNAAKPSPLFLALPWREEDGPREPTAAGVEGRWKCSAQETEGGRIEFEFGLIQTGVDVKTAERDNALSASGTFSDGRLELTVKSPGDEGAFRLTAVLREGTLTGEWSEEGGGTKGTWTATRVDTETGADMDRSPVVVPLYEYRRAGSTGGGWIYSTNPDLGDPAATRSANPICRVWRSPTTALALDWKAQPVPIPTGSTDGKSE